MSLRALGPPQLNRADKERERGGEHVEHGERH
jgi:hypothetical protein